MRPVFEAFVTPSDTVGGPPRGQPSTYLWCAANAVIIQTNVVATPRAPAGWPYDSVVCVGDLVTVTLNQALRPSTNASQTCHTCDGSRPTNWCDAIIYSPGATPFNISNQWWNSCYFYDTNQWAYYSGFSTSPNPSVSLRYTNAAVGSVGFSFVSAQMSTSPPSCGYEVWSGSSKSYAFVAAGSLSPTFDNVCYTDISPTNAPWTVWIVSTNCAPSARTNIIVEATPLPWVAWTNLPPGWTITGGNPVMEAGITNRTKRSVDLTQPGTNVIVVNCGLSYWKNTFIVTTPVKLNIAGYGDTNKYDPGVILFANADDDNTNCIPDLEETNSVIVAEDDLVPLSFSRGSAPLGEAVTLSAWTYAGHIKIWRSAQRGPEMPVIDTYNGPQSFTFLDNDMPTLYIEGISAGYYDNDITLSVSTPSVPCSADQARITVVSPTIQYITENGEVDDMQYEADPRPVVEMHFDGAPFVDDAGNLVINLYGHVSDPLSDLAFNPADRLQSLTFSVNGTSVASITDLPSLSSTNCYWPWHPNTFGADFHQTLVLQSPGGSDLLVHAETSQNAAGETGWAEGNVTLGWTEIDAQYPWLAGDGTNTPSCALNLAFSAIPTNTVVDTMRAYFGNRPPTNWDAIFAETGTNTMLFTGSLRNLAGGLTPFQVTTSNLNYSSGIINSFDADFSYQLGGGSNVTGTCSFTETAVGSLRFAQVSFLHFVSSAKFMG